MASYRAHAISLSCCSIFSVAGSLRENSGLQFVFNVVFPRQNLLRKESANEIENCDLFF